VSAGLAVDSLWTRCGIGGVVNGDKRESLYMMTT
jgi:hypothetical protein